MHAEAAGRRGDGENEGQQRQHDGGVARHDGGSGTADGGQQGQPVIVGSGQFLAVTRDQQSA